MLDRVEAWQSSLPVPCQVVLLPAVRDAFHHPTFPQPALNLMAHDQVGWGGGGVGRGQEGRGEGERLRCDAREGGVRGGCEAVLWGDARPNNSCPWLQQHLLIRAA